MDTDAVARDACPRLLRAIEAAQDGEHELAISLMEDLLVDLERHSAGDA